MSSPRAVIQAGGKGSRLRPYTHILPKPLMPVGEMPIMEIVVRQLAACGVQHITITLGHLGSLIQTFFGDGKKWDVTIDYCWEGKPLGTIGAVRQVPGLTEPFLVLNGDILTDLDFGGLYQEHLASNADVTIAVSPRTVDVPFGVLELDGQGRVVGFEEKPALHYLASMGVYVFSPEVLRVIPRGEYYGFDMLMADLLANKGRMQARVYDGVWLDIGRPEDHEQASALIEESGDRFLR